LSWPALGVALELRVLEVLKQRRIVLAGGPWRMEVTLEPGAISLAHSGASEGPEAEGVRSSWRMSLALLAHHLERHRARRRKVFWITRRAAVAPEAAHVFFTDEQALASWLTRSGGGIGESGSRYALTLVSGQSMSGRVLAATPGHDVIVSWEEDESSALALRTLPSARSPHDRLLAIAWSRWSLDEPPQTVLSTLDGALGRLASILARTSEA